MLHHAFPYFMLFTPPEAMPTSLRLIMSSKVPLQVTSASVLCHGPLHALELEDTAAVPDTPTPFFDNLLKTCQFHTLRSLTVANISTEALLFIGHFPSLADLRISNLPAGCRRPPFEIFLALQTATLFSSNAEHFAGFLQFLPRDNQVRAFRFTVTSYDEDTDPGDVIQAVANCCNAQTLREFVFEETTTIMQVEEPEDIDPSSNLDIAPLFPFSALEIVSINLTYEVHLDYSDIEGICLNWPNIKTLKIDMEYPNSRVPFIDHSHLLSLLYNLPHLEELGLRFDGTSLGEDSPKPEGCKYDNPAPVKKLWVSDSPILSPSEVAEFLRKHCPRLTPGDLTHMWNSLSSDDIPEGRFNDIYGRRWGAVEETLKEPLQA